jgi:small ligand-binding sensory domain FIST
MFFTSAVTTEPLLRDAIHRLETILSPQVANQSPDLMIVFLSAHFRGMASQIQRALQELFQAGQVIGCTAEGVISAQDELEQMPAISVLLANLPDTRLHPFYLEPDPSSATFEDNLNFQQAVGAPADTRLILLFADPFSTPVEAFLQAFDRVYPGIPVMGGLASAAMAVGQNALLLNMQTFRTGAVGLALSGDFEVDLVVSQGARPVGDLYVVTKAERNAILGLENKPPLFRIQEMVDTLPEEDHQLLQRGLLIGQAIYHDREQMGRGDFLIRGVLAADHHDGSITIGGNIQSGEMVQFHVRDALTAQEDLEMMLIPQAFRPVASGALLFTCNGRGRRLFDHPNGDISVVQRSLGNIPLSGFFCAGEIGPVGGRNFVHGHTACLAIFRPVQSRME